MKKYLKICTEGRGGIDDVEVIESNDVEGYVKKRFDEFVNDGEGEEDWSGYVEEFGCCDKRDWGWFVGLGEEDCMFVVDMDCELYKNFEGVLDVKCGEGWSLDDIDENLYDLIDELDY